MPALSCISVSNPQVKREITREITGKYFKQDDNGNTINQNLQNAVKAVLRKKIYSNSKQEK